MNGPRSRSSSPLQPSDRQITDETKNQQQNRPQQRGDWGMRRLEDGESKDQPSDGEPSEWFLGTLASTAVGGGPRSVLGRGLVPGAKGDGGPGVGEGRTAGQPPGTGPDKAAGLDRDRTVKSPPPEQWEMRQADSQPLVWQRGSLATTSSSHQPPSLSPSKGQKEMNEVD